MTMTIPDPPPQRPLLLRRHEMKEIDRGAGIISRPHLGRWNSPDASLTTGTTTLAPGAGVAPHTHNVEEAVLVIDGKAIAEVADQRWELSAGDATWVPAGLPHRFLCRGDQPLTIYWTYGGRRVTRTLLSTGETSDHLAG